MVKSALRQVTGFDSYKICSRLINGQMEGWTAAMHRPITVSQLRSKRTPHRFEVKYFKLQSLSAILSLSTMYLTNHHSGSQQ